MVKKAKGLGDSVEKVLKATGIDKVAKKVLGEDCGCEERKAKLNKLFPYKNPRQFTPDEMGIYESLLPHIKKGALTHSQHLSILKLYNVTFKAKKEPTRCISCIRNILTQLEGVYENSCKIEKNESNI